MQVRPLQLDVGRFLRQAPNIKPPPRPPPTHFPPPPAVRLLSSSPNDALADDPRARAFRAFRRELVARVDAGAVELPESFALLTLPPVPASPLLTETSSAAGASHASSPLSSSPTFVEDAYAHARGHFGFPPPWPGAPAGGSAAGGWAINRDKLIGTLQALAARETAAVRRGEERLEAAAPLTPPAPAFLAHHRVMMNSIVGTMLGFYADAVETDEGAPDAEFEGVRALSSAAAAAARVAAVGYAPDLRRLRAPEAAAAAPGRLSTPFSLAPATAAGGGAGAMHRFSEAPAVHAPSSGGFELRGLQASMAGVVPSLLPITEPAVEPGRSESVGSMGSNMLAGSSSGRWGAWPPLESRPDDLGAAAACFPHGFSAAARSARFGVPLRAFASTGEADADLGFTSPSAVSAAAPPRTGGTSPGWGSVFGGDDGASEELGFT